MNAGANGYSLAQLMMTEAGRLFVEQCAIDSDEAMADFCERRVNQAIRALEENPQFCAGWSEDQITNAIVLSLKAQGILADHDSMHGGHADILVRQRQFKWLAEAKIFDNGGFVWLMKGLIQLTTRYMAVRDRHGGLLIYTFNAEAARTIDAWRTRMEAAKRVLSVSQCAFCPLLLCSNHK